MKEFLGCVAFITFCLVVSVGAIWLCIVIFNAIWNSDIPMWIKWLLLR